jgi:hypothetical protein
VGSVDEAKIKACIESQKWYEDDKGLKIGRLEATETSWGREREERNGAGAIKNLTRRLELPSIGV